MGAGLRRGDRKSTREGMRWEEEEDAESKEEVPKLVSERSQHQDMGRTLSALTNTFLLHCEKCQVPLLPAWVGEAAELSDGSS